jgi:uncharacterized protein YlaN (UPF0358 family)
MRFELARRGVENGQPVEEAAEQLKIDVEKLKELIERRKTNPLMEQYKRTYEAAMRSRMFNLR